MLFIMFTYMPFGLNNLVVYASFLLVFYFTVIICVCLRSHMCKLVYLVSIHIHESICMLTHAW